MKEEEEEEEKKKRRKSAGVRREDGLSAYFKDKPAHPIAPGDPMVGGPSAIITIRYDYAIIVT